MKIETKFNIDDDVFFYESDSTQTGKVINFQVFVFNDGEVQIRYNVSGYSESLNEKHLFANKQELLTQLH